MIKILTLDIETFPNDVYLWSLFGDQHVSPNQIVAPQGMACYAAKWFGKKEILFDSAQHGVVKMLDKLWDLLNEADALVTFNGQSFDSPMINTEFVKNGYGPPSPYRHIDLYHTAKRIFRFPTSKLEWLAIEMGIGEKVKHEGMPLWIACMQGDRKAWQRMERYNKGDVRLTERLYKKWLPWLTQHPNLNLYRSKLNDRPSCPRCGSNHLHRRGYSMTNTLRYPRFQCSDCGKWVRSRKPEPAFNKDVPRMVDLPQ